MQFLDGLPFKQATSGSASAPSKGWDDFASIREVVSRRLSRLSHEGEAFPDLLLIDGGKGQLNAAMESMARSASRRRSRFRWQNRKRNSTSPARPSRES